MNHGVFLENVQNKPRIGCKTGTVDSPPSFCFDSHFLKMHHPFPLDGFKFECKVPTSVLSFDLLSCVCLGLYPNEAVTAQAVSHLHQMLGVWSKRLFIMEH